MRKKKEIFEEVAIEKLVHGGQGLGTLADGRKAFVWNSVPGETVKFKVSRKKKDFVEGIAVEILKFVTERDINVAPEIMASLPWKILDFSLENQAKVDIVKELFAREHISLPDFECQVFGPLTSYRNKMEYSFWGDDDGLSYAQFARGTHHKVKIQESLLVSDNFNDAGQALLSELNAQNIRAGDLKSVIIRSEKTDVVAALFVKTKEFPKLTRPDALKGLVVYYSDPRSPASVTTEELYRIGDTVLTSVINGKQLRYDVLSFFQVNIGIFEKALHDIKKHQATALPLVDMYGGVGTIGLALDPEQLTIVELDSNNMTFAKQNSRGTNTKVVHASTEKALEYITSDICLMVDPPRSGLHKDVVNRILDTNPKQVCYLSCNPATQARDVGMLKDAYDIEAFYAYNFFPHTPHIETLVILNKHEDS